jgi:hypothetical protein
MHRHAVPVLILLLATPATAHPEEQRAFAYEGYLERDGAPIHGTVQLDVVLALDEAGVPALTETHFPEVDQGRFAVIVGVEPLAGSLYEGAALYIGFAVDGEVLEGRQRIMPVPFATRAGMRPDATIANQLTVAAAQPRLKLDGSANDWHFTVESDGDFALFSQATGRAPLKIEPDAPDNSIRVNGPGGEVGLGTGAPTASLHIFGTTGNRRLLVEETATSTFNRTLALLKNNGPVALGLEDATAGVTWRTRTASSNFIVDIAGGGGNNPQQLVLTSAGDLTILGTLAQSSDARLKTDVRRLERPLERLREVKGVTYARLDRGRERGADRDLGVLAQDVERAFPEAVRTDAAGMKSVAYANLIAPLVEAVKELDEERRQQAEKIRALEARLERLEAAAGAR